MNTNTDNIVIGVFRITLAQIGESNLKKITNKHNNIIFKEYSDLEVMLQDLHAKKDKPNHIDFIFMPAKTEETNEVAESCMELIQRLDIENMIEIGSTTLKIPLKATQDQTYEAYIENNDLLRFSRTNYQLDETKESMRNVNFKFFKLNTYKTPFYKRLLILLFANKYVKWVGKVVSFISVICLITSVILASLPDIGVNIPWFAYLADILPIIILVSQFFMSFFDIEGKVKKSILTGKWIYYAFEDEYDRGSYVPKGFTTRLFDVTNRNDDFTFTCSFSGKDTLFFSTDQVTFDYNANKRIATGMYTYVSNITNPTGKRDDGVCKYYGKANRNDVITYLDGWFTGRGIGIRGRLKYFRISDEDYDILKKSYAKINNSFDNCTIMVGIFGDIKTNTDVAFDTNYHSFECFKNVKNLVKKYYNSLQDIERDMMANAIDFAICPTSNKGENYDQYQFLNKSDKVKPLVNVKIKMSYVLATRDPNYKLQPGKTIFYSHEDVLKQCSQFIEQYQGDDSSFINTRNAQSTSNAAKQVRLGYTDDDVVAICNEPARMFYGLSKVSDENGKEIHPYISKEHVENETVFTLYARILDEEDQKDAKKIMTLNGDFQ